MSKIHASLQSLMNSLRIPVPFTRTIKKFSAIGLVVFSSLITPFFTDESSYGYNTSNKVILLSRQEKSQKIMMAQRASANLDVSVDVLGITNLIISSIKSSKDRGGFVKNVMNTAFYGSEQRYNVMVFNLSQNYQQSFRGVKFYGSAVYDGVTFGIWVFENGEFINQGDGGWINWAFSGWFERNGKYVKFRKP
ncbi:hypothetical protein [Dolichospermum flos-aquae]|uniref:Uncharacterized protein n=1 Tax=Dolichospermum flos-aquae LEGE 04289 TaxID=1828708 RepID=A0ACC5PY69_DOLFA|nr:hypothetical protein [Dolichospermum flos-aquae]MBE9217695.1 hypothetical protein [Dolichospermum flos-aquae LEGE 04289]